MRSFDELSSGPDCKCQVIPLPPPEMVCVADDVFWQDTTTITSPTATVAGTVPVIDDG